MPVSLHISFQVYVTYFVILNQTIDMQGVETWKFLLEGIALPVVGFFGVTGLNVNT